MQNSGLYLQVQATWPVISGQVNPLEIIPDGITIPEDVNPLQPVMSILFNHGISSAIYASNEALGDYVFLTSLSDPSATNITSFTNVQYAARNNLLVFQPAEPLTPGSRYSATLRSTLRDSNNRGMLSSYTWEFDVSKSAYSGVPEAKLFSPANKTVITEYPFKLSWVHPSHYIISTGCVLHFIVSVYSDQERTTLLWRSILPNDPSSTGSVYNTYISVPSFDAGILSTPGNFYWGVISQIVDSNNNPVSTSTETELFSFYFTDNETNLIPDIGGGGDGGTSFPDILQKNPLYPPQTFRVLSVTPYPGYVLQDFVPIQ